MKELKVYGHEIQIGDRLRFRMSKLDTVLWLPIERIEPSETGKRLIVSGRGWQDVVSKEKKQRIRREEETA